MLDFTRLRSEVSGFRGAFEGLVCQLGRRNPPLNPSYYTTIDGSGGDGGLEAYWVASDGTELGYQAKFHLKSSDIDWGKIDASVKAALTSHPNMVAMVLAIACDLTNVVPNRRGKSGREHWDAHLKKWEALAASQDRIVAFVLWDASTIEDMLTRDTAKGLRSYWFGDIELSSQWLRSEFDKAAAALDERYSPNDHVEVSTEALFGGLLRDERFYKAIESHCANVISGVPKRHTNLHSGVTDTIKDLEAAAEDLARYQPNAFEDVTKPFPVSEYVDRLNKVERAAAKLSAAIDQHRPARESSDKRDPAEHYYEIVESQYWQLLSTCEQFEAFLKGTFCEADTRRFALLTGRAGAGKSHLLARQVDELTKRNVPAVIFIGGHFTDHRTIPEQIPGLLGLQCDFHMFLAALNAAGEARGRRALLVVDAINEGGGKKWFDTLATIPQLLKCYPYLAFVASCRTEYEKYLISDPVRNSAAVQEVEGFVTADEQEQAAEIYLDKRGILRPATPWLSPEFDNPLFLRTTATALEAQGTNEYPKGLHGTKMVLSFFLKVMARNLATPYDGSDELVRPLAAAVRAVAAEMTALKQDYLLMPSAAAIVDKAFEGYTKPDRNWIDILRLRGILRQDPLANDGPDDPLEMPLTVIRFAFQRFQDHLIAESLLNIATPSPEQFTGDGPLAFLLQVSPRGDISSVAYSWSGVFQALWIGHAERNKRELLDDLPQKPRTIFRSDMFTESVYWRSTDAFTDRTLEIFNQQFLANGLTNYEHIRILLRLSVGDHPWNALFLDKNLARMRLPARDAFWTVPINALTRYGDDRDEIERLLRWTYGPAVQRATDDVISRALITLGWIFSTTNRAIRDKATKAALRILLLRPSLTPDFISRFATVDDLYVLERVIASVAGACLRDPSPARLRVASLNVYDAFFATGTPPIHLLARDYARLVVELAHNSGCLPTNIDISLCRPPYNTRPPRLPKSANAVEARARKVGAGAIFDSCAGFIGDFGRYVVEGRVDDFSKVLLSSKAPEAQGSKWQRKQSLTYDIQRAKLWVANRAVSLGWTNKYFPRDPSYDHDRGRGSRIERIGKKYQWIAYFELLALLADNYWILDDYADIYARAYDTPNDTPYVRDIEISFPPSDGDGRILLNSELGFERVPLTEVDPIHHADWAFDKRVAKQCLTEAFFEKSGEQWLSIYRYSSARIEWRKERSASSHNTRQDEFHFQMVVGVPAGKQQEFVERAQSAKVDFHDWLPEDRTDRGYLYELGQRDTWDEGRQAPERGHTWDGMRVVQFSVGYHWEHHLDGTMPHGLQLQVPSRWLLQDMEVTADPFRPGRYVRHDGRLLLASGRVDGSQWCIARRGEFEALLNRHGLAPVWIAIGERSTYPEHRSGKMRRSRWNATMHINDGTPSFSDWHDHKTIPGRNL